MRAFKKIQSNDFLLNQIQSNITDAINPLINNLITQGHFINNISLTSGIQNIVPLGQTNIFNGWVLTRQNSNSVVWDSQATNNTPNKNLILNCSANCIISLYVF